MNEQDWGRAAGVICPICGNPTLRLLPYGFSGSRKACPNCISRRIKLIDYKARVLPNKRARPARGAETALRLMLIKYDKKRK